MTQTQLNRLTPIDLAAENDRRGGLFHAFDAADLVEQLVQLFWRITAQPRDIIELPADCTQLLDLRHGAEAPHHNPCRSVVEP